ncbi:hypothetical protein DL96DRAFT_1627561 [Flagelloscypha sp. PMI_526]|nr:hypothetical protein DL96DRAFT_1627561 [Flagelloscypha sp. PMI_526]
MSLVIPPALLEMLKEQVNASDLSLKMEFAALSILIWDYLLTLDLEFSVIWWKKWNWGTLLFFLTRYLPFTDLLISIIRVQVMDAGDSRKSCPGPYAATVWLEVAGVQIAQLILILRTWALYGGNKWILVSLLALQIGTVVYCGVADQQLIDSIVWAGPEFSGLSGCVVLAADNLRDRLAGNYLSILILETCILVLTCIRAFTFRRDGTGGSLLIQTIQNDGLIFYIFILGISLINVVVIFTAPQSYVAILLIFQRTMHSIATGRILLHIRQVAAPSSIPVQPFGSRTPAHESMQLETFHAAAHPSLPQYPSHLNLSTSYMK